jgi:hypothetical protein
MLRVEYFARTLPRARSPTSVGGRSGEHSQWAPTSGTATDVRTCRASHSSRALRITPRRALPGAPKCAFATAPKLAVIASHRTKKNPILQCARRPKTGLSADLPNIVIWLLIPRDTPTGVPMSTATSSTVANAAVHSGHTKHQGMSCRAPSGARPTTTMAEPTSKNSPQVAEV